MSLHRLVYMSTAVGVLRADELDKVYLRAKASNAAAGITGLLLFYEGTFLQLLEGPAAGISSLMQKLRRDKRHANLIILESSPIETRIFPAAPMQHDVVLGDREGHPLGDALDRALEL